MVGSLTERHTVNTRNPPTCSGGFRYCVSMKPFFERENVRVFHGDCREVLRHLPDNSVDSVVTDPPYELGFMGKKWDSSGIAYDSDVWSECLRVLKPGGHLLAFGGSRTFHRLGVAIEDAGFEIRDSIAWLSNKTFPKSLDVSKAIDKTNGEGGRKLKFTKWMRTTGLKVSEASRVLREAKLISENGTMAAHFFADSLAGQPAIPTAELWAVLRPHCGEVPDWVDKLVARVQAEREVIGQRDVPKGHSFASEKYGKETGTKEINDTKPKTQEAKKWEGWGTALKPCFEPVVVGRKPLEGTVAENTLRWGVGGINIDATRVSDEKRWPANACVDETVAEDLGKNARYFFVGKATAADRDEGLEDSNHHPTVKATALMSYLVKMVTPPGGVVLDPFTGSGSTGKAAVLDGFGFIGVELTAEYLPVIEGRLKWALQNQNKTLF